MACHCNQLIINVIFDVLLLNLRIQVMHMHITREKLKDGICFGFAISGILIGMRYSIIMAIRILYGCLRNAVWMSRLKSFML